MKFSHEKEGKTFERMNAENIQDERLFRFVAIRFSRLVDIVVTLDV